MTAKPDIRELVGRLERAWVEPATAELTTVAATLTERQQILDEIQKADATGLDPETRQDLARRIQHVRERDGKLLAVLEERRAGALKELDQALNAREATRGYRASEGKPGPGFRKIA